ncbi:response regulator transcription factor [Clostridium paraputrificum]|uniref:response regulator transcription factor n=1 Tax=Clostridium paraputrificum TaxID=29363 RepID=UPI0034A1C42C
MRKNILIVEDEIRIRFLLRDYFQKEDFLVYEAENGKEALEIFKSNKIDLIILDIMMPVMDGLTVLEKIREVSTIPVILLTAKGQEEDKLQGYDFGADDYITKPFSAREVAFRVKARLRTFSKISIDDNKIIKFDNIEIHKDKGTVYKDGNLLEFTAKELKLLLYFIDNPNRILSKEMICNEVWGEDFFGYDNTITVHIRKLRKKIEKDPSNPKYITTVIGLGYKFIKEGKNDI